MTDTDTDTDTEFKTYWVVNGCPCHSEHTAIQRSLTGASVVEISAEQQRANAERQKQRHRQAMIDHARIRREIMRRQYEASPEGRRDSALRSAAESGGSIVTVATNNDNFAELDTFGRDATNIFHR